jgi:hyperosmotically inducible periplasmic protein
MKREFAQIVLAAAIALTPLVFTPGCAVTSGKESAKSYASDKEIASRVKTALYADPTTKGTEIKVQSLNGVVELSGFVDNEAAKQRAGQIAASTPGVAKVYNNLILPTGR